AVDIAVATATQGRQVLKVAGTLRVVPDRIDMVGVQPAGSHADDALESVPLVDGPSVARDPRADQLAFAGDAALPEVRGPTGACRADVGEALGSVLMPNKSPALAALRQSGELGLLFRGELQAEHPQSLPDRVIGDPGAVGDRLHRESFRAPRPQPIAVPMCRHTVHGELGGFAAPCRTASDSQMNAGGFLKGLPTVRGEAAMVFRHLDGVAVVEGHLEDRAYSGLPHIEHSRVIDVARYFF